MSAVSLHSRVNVHLPAEYVKLIDEGLGPSQPLSLKGYKGRADVVRHAVYKFLIENGISPTLTPEMIDSPKSRKRETLTETEFWRILTKRH